MRIFVAGATGVIGIRLALPTLAAPAGATIVADDRALPAGARPAGPGE